MAFSLNPQTGLYTCDKCKEIGANVNWPDYHRCKPIPQIPLSFHTPCQNKTLKLKPKSGSPLEVLVSDAYKYLWNQTEYNRIEFKYNKSYIVVAKLKDE